MAACARCGEENPAPARYCSACGSPLRPATTEMREVRKTVTALFCDVTGSTELGERLDPEAVRSVMDSYFAIARAAVERHGGTVEKFIGDAVMAVFGVPVLHEDDAPRAVRAAIDIRDGLDRLNDRLEREGRPGIRVRTGISTGPVLAGDPTGAGTFVTGDAVNEAARLEQHAAPGEILVAGSTYRLVRDAVRVETLEPLIVKGKAQPVVAFRVTDVAGDSPGHARRLDAALVGRQGELRMLLGAFERTLREHNCHLFTVLGAAGIGKTRLVAEVAALLEHRAVVLTSRCLAYGEDVAFRPLRDLVQQAARLKRGDSPERARDKIATQVGAADLGALVTERVAEVIGLTESTAPVEELFWGVRKLLEAAGRSGPLVVVIDDLHWAVPSLLDLIEHVADWWQGSPLLLVCVARPELLDDRPSWGGGRMNATSLLLEPLDRGQCTQLLANLVHGAPLDEAATTCIIEGAEGNPLFVEEFLSMLIDDGVLRLADGRWELTGDLSGVSVPPSIQTLLVARLDRLPAAECSLLERASVVGREFSPDSVQALGPGADRAEVSQLLVRLLRRQLVRFERSGLFGEEGFAFRHALLRDAAYRRLAKRDRSELHERFAAFLERMQDRGPDRYDEVVGHHLEQAYLYRAEVGALDAASPELAARAAARLGAAGRRALHRSDVGAAADLLARARRLWQEPDSGLVDVLTDLGEAMTRAGDFAGAEAALDEAAAIATALGDQGREWHARLEGARTRLWSDPERGIEAAGTTARSAMAVFERVGDELGLAKSCYLLAQRHLFLCQGAECERLLKKGAGHARSGGDSVLELRILSALVSQVPLGPTTVSDGLALCRSVMGAARASRMLQAAAMDGRALLEAMLGRFVEARELLEQERRVLADIGDELGLAGAPLTAGEVEVLAGNWAGAEEQLRQACRHLDALGERQLLSSCAALLAHALAALGSDDEADHFSQVSEQTAAADDILAQVGWRGARARVRSHRGDPAGAERLALESVRIAERTDFVNMRADALMDLGAVLAAQGDRRDDAASVVQRALTLYESKGNLAAAGTARRVLTGLAAG